MKHLLIDISGHGFGHLGQTSAVINALKNTASGVNIDLDIKLTIRSTLPESIVRDRIHLAFDYIHHELDKGMVMNDAVHTDVEASLDWYIKRHSDYETLVSNEIEIMEQLQPDLVFANVTYLSLEAATNLGIPSIALCSLNWFDILNAYCGNNAKAKKVLNQIQKAYSKANVFLRPEPSIKMESFGNTQSISPITTKGIEQRSILLQTIASKSSSTVNSETKFVLVSLGGIPSDFPLDKWPEINNVVWIMPSLKKENQIDREDMLSIDDLDIPFIDVISSVDVVFTKTGYGTMVEAVAHQKPILCIERGDWPEEAKLFPWCQEKGYLEVISFSDFEKGSFKNQIDKLLEQEWEKPPVITDGVVQAANIIKSYLD